MEIVGITTAVNYDDYLSETIGGLVRETDRMYVVTRFGDRACDVATSAGATAMLFDDWERDGASFNKSGALFHAQKHVHAEHPDSWYLIVDADIVLPVGARGLIESCRINEDAIYGAYRSDFYTPDSVAGWMPDKRHDLPLSGYFQLYKKHLMYPPFSKSAERCDMEFLFQFPERRLLPLTVAHLGRENVNWNGRRSPRWGK